MGGGADAPGVRGDGPLDGSEGSPVLHVDMDAFYAAVAIRDRPELRDVPVIVGGGHRGVVLSANYPARAHGIRSGMPGPVARRLCPAAVVVPPDFERFTEVSRAVREVFASVGPEVEVLSLDEAFFDVRGAARRLGTPLAIAELIRARISDEQAITCSVGVAPVPTVAKVASRKAKPDGVVVVPADGVAAFLHPLDVGDLYGVGEATKQRLLALGLTTVGELAHTPEAVLRHHFGPHGGRHLHGLAWGTDGRRVGPSGAGVFGHGAGEPESSMGAQETLGENTRDRAVVARELLRLAGGVARRLRKAGKAGRTVALTVRYSDFVTINRSRTLHEPTDVTREVHATALALYDALGPLRLPIRLLGVRVEGLVESARLQPQLVLGEPDPGWAAADRAADEAARRFGSRAVRPATLLGREARATGSVGPGSAQHR